jgi:hypothetical protein
LTDFSSASGAVFSADRKYRYALWRNWQGGRNRVLFVALNPSTADESGDDPTIRRCIGFARNWGFGGVLVGNLCALRATDPAMLRASRSPVGRHNARWLERLRDAADLVVLCWGNHGQATGQERAVSGLFQDPHCLGVNAGGAPSHPLYLSASLRPKPYRPVHRGGTAGLNRDRVA